MHRSAASLAAAFLPALAVHAQPFCDPPPVIDPSLTVIVEGAVHLGGDTRPVSGTMELLRDPDFGCEPASGSITIPDLDCDAQGVVFGAGGVVVAKAVIWILKWPSEAKGCINVLDLACGDLAGDFAMGSGPEQVTGSFTATLVNPSTVSVTIDITLSQDPPGAFTGEWTSVERITAGPPGTALATGRTAFRTPDGPTVNSDYTVEYELVGNPDVVFPVPLTIRQTVDFDCRTGLFTSEVCAFSTASIPTVSEWAMIAMTLLMLTGGTFLIRHRAMAGAGSTTMV